MENLNLLKFSDERTNIIKSWVKAQDEIKSVKKDKINPTFKSAYYSLDDILGTVKPILSKHGLIVVQNVSTCSNDNPDIVNAPNGYSCCETTIFHESGEWVSTGLAKLPLPIPNKAQTVAQVAGVNFTYLRRQQLSAILGICDCKDEDGNMHQGYNNQQPVYQNLTLVNEEQLNNIASIVKAKNITDAQVMTYITGAFRVGELSKLNVSQYEQLIQALQSAN